MARERECLVMAKPAGARCNLRCDYCYYLDTEARLGSPLAPSKAPGSWAPMPASLLERYIAQRIEASPGPSTHFEWHGGEPTLLGLGYFERIVRAQRAHLPAGRSLSNGIQTNGVLIDGAWADFLARENFSVGLSLDGPADLHDRHRRGRGGEPSHAAAMRAFGLLRERGVFVNILCVLHEGNAAEPESVYSFFERAGAKYLQFLPLAPRPGQAGAIAAAASAERIGEFLCGAFDLWIARGVGRMVVQTFDEALRPIYGVPHALCVHRETCGDVAVLERDGGFYACDHFVDREHLLGRLTETRLGDLADDPRLLAFGQAKRDRLPQSCLECEVLGSCNGGCPKDRFLGPGARAGGAKDGLNYFCAAYKRFFTHSRAALTALAAHMRAGKSLRSFALPSG